MSLDVAPEAPNNAPVSVVGVPEGTPDAISSIREAARLMASHRHAKKEADASAEAPAADEPPQVSDEQSDAAAETPPSETQETDAAPAEPELPPVEPPRSWSKEDKDWFKDLPREQAERIADRERSRELDLNRRQQEAAEKQKALEAQTQAAEQTRQQYENALPILFQTLQQQQSGQFADIQTMADVERMASEDPFRYSVWDVQQKKLAAVQQEIAAAQERQKVEQSQSWQSFASKEDALFAEKVPEITDPEKGAKLRDAAVGVLKDLGFSQEELQKAWTGQEKISLRDHRFQQLLVEATKFRDAKAKAKVAPPKPVPPVAQRPGVSRSANAGAEEAVKNLEQKLEKTGSWKDAAELLMAKRKASRR